MVNSRQTRQSVTRFFRGALLFVFAAAAILPFCTAFFLCAMPCCHGGATPPSAAMKAPMPACPGSATEGCATEITASVERNTATVAAPTSTAVKLVVVQRALVTPQVPAAALPFETPPAPAPAALHLLNSVFRI